MHIARAAGVVVTVTRAEAVARLLDAAIGLWIHDGDAIAVHVLMFASYQCLEDVARYTGKQPPVLRQSVLQGTDPTAAYDYLRHADEHPRAELDFAPEINAPLLFDAVTAFEGIFGNTTLSMRSFRAYYLITPDLNVSESIRKQADVFLPHGVAVSDVASLSRPDFFRKVAEQFAVQYGAGR